MTKAPFRHRMLEHVECRSCGGRQPGAAQGFGMSRTSVIVLEVQEQEALGVAARLRLPFLSLPRPGTHSQAH